MQSSAIVGRADAMDCRPLRCTKGGVRTHLDPHCQKVGVRTPTGSQDSGPHGIAATVRISTLKTVVFICKLVEKMGVLSQSVLFLL